MRKPRISTGSYATALAIFAINFFLFYEDQMVMKRFKKFLVFTLISGFVISLCGCSFGGSEEPVNAEPDTGVQVTDPDTGVTDTEPVPADIEYINADLAKINVYDHEDLLVEFGGEDNFAVSSGTADDGVFFVFRTTDEYYNSAYYLMTFDDEGNKKDTVVLSLPVYYESSDGDTVTSVMKANESRSGVMFDQPAEILEEYGFKTETCDYFNYTSFAYAGNDLYEGILELYSSDSKGNSYDLAFDVVWDSKGSCRSIDLIPAIRESEKYYNHFHITTTGDLFVCYSGYDERDDYIYGYRIYGPDRHDDFNASLLSSSEEYTEWADYMQSVFEYDGNIYVRYSYGNEMTPAVGRIDKELNGIADVEDFQTITDSVLNPVGNSDDGFVIFSDDNGLLKWTPGNRTGYFLDFINSDIPSDHLNNFVSVSDTDTFYATYYDNAENLYVAFCDHVKPEDVEDCNVITLAYHTLNKELCSLICDFNASHDDVRIVGLRYNREGMDYSNYDSYIYKDVEDGKPVDIMYISSGSSSYYRTLASEGKLADILDLMEKDPGMDTEDLVPGIVEAAKIGDGMYQVVPSYYLSTLIGNSEFFGETSDWTVDDLIEFSLRAENENTMLFQPYLSRRFFVEMMMEMSGYEWIDPDNKTCDFNDPSFYKLVGYAMSLPEYADYASEKTMLYNNDYDTFMREIGYKAATCYDSKISDIINDGYSTFGCEPVLLGFPSVSGSRPVVRFYDFYAINADSKLIEDAWDFVKVFYSEEYQEKAERYSLPVLKSVFEESVRSSLGYGRYFEEYGFDEDYIPEYYFGGEYYELPPVSEEQIDAFLEHVYSARNCELNDAALLSLVEDIICENADGGKTPEEVGTLVQAAVQDYLTNEYGKLAID